MESEDRRHSQLEGISRRRDNNIIIMRIVALRRKVPTPPFLIYVLALNMQRVATLRGEHTEAGKDFSVRLHITQHSTEQIAITQGLCLCQGSVAGTYTVGVVVNTPLFAANWSSSRLQSGLQGTVVDTLFFQDWFFTSTFFLANSNTFVLTSKRICRSLESLASSASS